MMSRWPTSARSWLVAKQRKHVDVVKSAPGLDSSLRRVGGVSSIRLISLGFLRDHASAVDSICLILERSQKPKIALPLRKTITGDKKIFDLPFSLGLDVLAINSLILIRFYQSRKSADRISLITRSRQVAAPSETSNMSISETFSLFSSIDLNRFPSWSAVEQCEEKFVLTEAEVKPHVRLWLFSGEATARQRNPRLERTKNC